MIIQRKQYLQVALGHATRTGPRDRNEDFCGVATPTGRDLVTKGVIAAVADGLGGHRGGREAAEYTVRGLLSDYYATPETWSTAKSVETVLNALNRWVLAEGARNAAVSGMATTLSALVFRGERYLLAHIGDSRAYRLRDGQLTQLSHDHTWDHPELKGVLSRAIGLDARLLIDVEQGTLMAGDRFLLLTDGVWGPLPSPLLQEVLLSHEDPQTASSALVSMALANGGQDNASCVVIDIVALPEQSLVDALQEQALLLPPGRLKPGQMLDGLVVEELLHESRETLLYKVRDVANTRTMVLKTLQPDHGDLPVLSRVLILEEWRGKRLISKHLPDVLPAEQRSCLYFLMAWHPGASLQQRLDRGQHFTVQEAIGLGIQLCRGLAALHRMDIIHRDIKPANLHLGTDGVLRLLDLGVSLALGESDQPHQLERVGTPSFMAPEWFQRDTGHSGSTASDFYAVGVTLYHLLTRKYPYGEIEPFQSPRFGHATPPTRWRPDIPVWLEQLILKACSVEPAERFETAEELLIALQRADTVFVRMAPKQPLIRRNPVRVWQWIGFVLLLSNIALLILLKR
ncbi:bifunctional protein-serine/threonine kinase/phosphatase [Limnobacter humi]|uniref:Bifunctional protein-serine/threonine kinase/phosphatase n=1 Tax=Limnobacter humi TaxID=1778671 RepID=A0ABT1WGC7_9BURK|nr:bifunctional protein-serine/threonine kinase/phosphatase [Limnobacter humi]MCQ8895958.1 bifunctional protein-serine/threonine kinase/phosphatase [Limnobacter humi]